MMPRHLFLVRHGQSEGNVTQDLPLGDPLLAQVKEVPDMALRLTLEGVKQATVAGDWLRERLRTLALAEQPAGFVSPFVRAMETAGLLGLGLEWQQQIFIVERDWGKFAELTEEEQRLTKQRKKIDPLFCTMPNGQNLSALLLSNYLFVGMLHRELTERAVVAVCHGERILTLRMMLERMTVKRFGDLIRSSHTGDKVRNTQIVEYSRIDPSTGVEAKRYEWMRSLCPWDIREKDLAWKPIVRSRLNDADLLRAAEEFPRYLA